VAIQGVFCGRRGEFFLCPTQPSPLLFFLIATSHPRPTYQSGLLISTGFIPFTLSIEFLSLVLRQLHFPALTHGGLFDHTKLNQAHILELGCVLQILPRTFSNFPQNMHHRTHLRSMKNQRRNGTPRARTRTPSAQVYGDGHSRPRPSPPQKLGLGVRAFNHWRRRRRRSSGSGLDPPSAASDRYPRGPTRRAARRGLHLPSDARSPAAHDDDCARGAATYSGARRGRASRGGCAARISARVDCARVEHMERC